MESVELKVDGLTCGSCVKAATRALSAVAGVDAVDVRLETGLAGVRGQDLGERIPAMLAALATAGYQARTAVGASDTVQPVRSGCGSGGKSGGGCCCGH